MSWLLLCYGTNTVGDAGRNKIRTSMKIELGALTLFSFLCDVCLMCFGCYFFFILLLTGIAMAVINSAANAPVMIFPVGVLNQFIKVSLEDVPDSSFFAAATLSLSAGIFGVMTGSGSEYST